MTPSMSHIRFRRRDIFELLKSGLKTVETRALNPDEPDRYFGQIKPGDLLLCEFVDTGEVICKIVTDVRVYKDFKQYLKQEDLKKIFGKDTSVAEAEKIHFSFPGYEEKLTRYGIVAIELGGAALVNIGTAKDIKKYIDGHFFDSLRFDYPEFDSWFAKKCLAENRACLFSIVANTLEAVMILKKEKPSEHLLTNIGRPVTKICTFKVSEKLNRQGFGSLLLAYAESWAKNNNTDSIYLTVPMVSENDHSSLLSFLAKNNFKQTSLKNNSNTAGDEIYVRSID